MSKKVDLVSRNKCRICGNSDIRPFANLGYTPLADKFISFEEIKDEKSYPLEVVVCNECKLVQLNHDVNDNELFGNDYAFFTSASPSSIKYFEEYAKDVFSRYPNQSKGKVIEIASNDGTLLKHFQDIGATVLGIDPAIPPAELAERNGIPTITNFFNRELADEPLIRNADLVLANNVIAHVTDLNDVFQGVREILSSEGVFVFEVQYFPNLLLNLEFDHIYHEHRSFFSLNPLNTLISNNGMRLVDVIKTQGQGGSIRVTAVLDTSSRRITDNVIDLLKYEAEIGLLDIKTYSDFQSKIDNIRDNLQGLIDSNDGKVIYGYGASAKSCTLLNYCGFDSMILPVILDKTPYKIGKLTPGTHIPVVDRVPLDPDIYLCLIWNYLPGILEREKEFIKNGGKFIVPIPEPKMI